LIYYHALLKFFCRILVLGLFVSSIVCPSYLSTLLFFSIFLDVFNMLVSSIFFNHL
jgi:hypothetical protein